MKRRINKNEDDQNKDSVNLMELQVPQGPPPLRTIGLFGDLDEEKVEDVCSGLLYLRHTSCLLMPGDNPEEEIKPKPVTFYVSTWGGDALGMFGIYDLMRMVREDCPIHTHGIGKVMSAGVLLLAAGTKGKRRLGKHCRVMIHAVNGGQVGDLHNLQNELEQTVSLQDSYIQALSHETNMTKRQIQTLINRKVNVYLSAEEAIEKGLADEVL